MFASRRHPKRSATAYEVSKRTVPYGVPFETSLAKMDRQRTSGGIKYLLLVNTNCSSATTHHIIEWAALNSCDRAVIRKWKSDKAYPGVDYDLPDYIHAFFRYWFTEFEEIEPEDIAGLRVICAVQLHNFN